RGDLRALGYYVEGKYTLTPRLHVSGRWAQMFFSQIDDGLGNDTPWDRDVNRAQVGVGYLFAPNLLGKAEYEFNWQKGHDPDDDLASVSLSLSF
ncbi:MAG: hypothetical protein HYZ53_15390, partial [Planctomycetes bacterium]|nr:hypothetical protein [Planctomycetota bacterium]